MTLPVFLGSNDIHQRAEVGLQEPPSSSVVAHIPKLDLTADPYVLQLLQRKQGNSIAASVQQRQVLGIPLGSPLQLFDDHAATLWQSRLSSIQEQQQQVRINFDTEQDLQNRLTQVQGQLQLLQLEEERQKWQHIVNHLQKERITLADRVLTMGQQQHATSRQALGSGTAIQCQDRAVELLCSPTDVLQPAESTLFNNNKHRLGDQLLSKASPEYSLFQIQQTPLTTASVSHAVLNNSASNDNRSVFSPKKKNPPCYRERMVRNEPTRSDRRFHPYQEGQWSARFEELCAFKKEHGHCLVPHVYKTNQKLARWVKRQRYQYKLFVSDPSSSTMTKQRVALLEAQDFCWDSQGLSWEDKLEELKAFRSQHGHCNVPSSYKNFALAHWVKCQRRQYRLERQGLPNNLTAERLVALEQLGFEWVLRPGPPSRKNGQR